MYSNCTNCNCKNRQKLTLPMTAQEHILKAFLTRIGDGTGTKVTKLCLLSTYSGYLINYCGCTNNNDEAVLALQSITALHFTFCLVNPLPTSVDVAFNLIAADSENVVYLSTTPQCHTLTLLQVKTLQCGVIIIGVLDKMVSSYNLLPLCVTNNNKGATIESQTTGTDQRIWNKVRKGELIF